MTHDLSLALAFTLVGLLHVGLAAKPPRRTTQLPPSDPTLQHARRLWIRMHSVIGLVYVGIALWLFLR
jgi:hypothetical protein